MRMSDVIAEPYHRSNRHLISRIRLIEGDLTQENDVEAVVTTIPLSLKAEGSLNTALFAAAGAQMDDFLLEHVLKPQPGQVFAVPGFNMAAPYILFVITPEWRVGDFLEDRDLLRCYRSAIQTAREMGLKKIAFAALGTGARTYPAKRAARLGIQGIMDRIDESIEEVRIVCNRRETFTAFHDWLVHYGWEGFKPPSSQIPHS